MHPGPCIAILEYASEEEEEEEVRPGDVTLGAWKHPQDLSREEGYITGTREGTVPHRDKPA
eukprot:4763835-Prymnesium_polylepis.1